MNASPSLAARIRRRLAEEAAKRFRTRTARAANPRPMISFTFDDVPVSASTEGAAILERFDVRGTFYVAGALCGTEGEDYPHLSADACLALHRNGHEIACHTFSHRHVATLGHAALEDEVNRNRAFFERLGGIRLRDFSYPFGGVSLSRKRQLETLFCSCRSTMPGVNGPILDLGYLRAVVLYHGIGADQVQRWIDRAVRENGWLIFVCHDIAERHGPWGSSPARLADAVGRAVGSGSDVVSLGAALSRAGITR